MFENNLSPAEKSERKRILIASLGALFSINTLLLCAEAVLPTYIDERHKAFIDESKVALIIAAPEVGCLLLSPVVGILLDKFGRKNCALLGFIMLVS